jgi:hypothetical protein
MKKLLILLSIAFMSCEKEHVIIKRTVSIFGVGGSGKYICSYKYDGKTYTSNLAAHQKVIVTLKEYQPMFIGIIDEQGKELKLTVWVDGQSPYIAYGNEIYYTIK